MKKFAFALALLMMPLFMFAGCGGSSESNKIVLSEVTHSIFYAPLYIAMSNNYFTDEGLTVELVNGNGSNNVMTSIVSGSATIGLAGPETAVYTALQSGNASSPKVFGQLTACDGSFLIGRTANPDFTLEDLRGKTIIAGRRGGMPAMTLEYALKQHGMIAGRDYTLNLDYEFGMVATAFEAGTGDYCTMFEPVASAYQATGKGAIVASIGEMGGYVPYTAFIANEQYLHDNALQAEQFLRAVYRGYLYLMNAPIDDAVNALMPQFTGSDKTSIKSAVENYKSLDAFASSPVMTQDGYDRLCAIITDAGELTQQVAFNKVIDNTIANKVVNYFNYA